MNHSSNPARGIGTLREFADWTLRVVRDPEAARGMSKTWADHPEGAIVEPPVATEGICVDLSVAPKPSQRRKK